jgi:hypothetical protein
MSTSCSAVTWPICFAYEELGEELGDGVFSPLQWLRRSGERTICLAFYQWCIAVYCFVNFYPSIVTDLSMAVLMMLRISGNITSLVSYKRDLQLSIFCPLLRR